MCGIAGFWGEQENPVLSLRRMAGKMYHRGPDIQNHWFDSSASIGLAHARLSILDLTAAGLQPMLSSTGRFVIVYNGEVYNHLQIRKELDLIECRNWTGTSDTETILMAFEQWGFTPTLERLVGMFSIALWDRKENSLSIARDRLGEKPLYWGWSGNCLLFASDLAAFDAVTGFSPAINRNSLALLLKHGYIPSPHTIYDSFYKLRAGHYVVFKKHGLQGFQKDLESKPYWTLHQVISSGIKHPFVGSESDAINLLDKELTSIVSSQMLSDVPLGAFLSGGIDSSTIVSLMQKSSALPIRTFTIGFDDKSYNEAVHAKSIANHLGTNHTDLYISEKDIFDVLHKIPSIYSEPFADSSQIPTYLVSQLAHSHVTVALSGDGGDELFGGYNRYLGIDRFWRKIQKYPRPLRRLLAIILSSYSPSEWNKILERLGSFLPSSLATSAPGDKIYKLIDILYSDSIVSYYQKLTSHWSDPTSVVLGSSFSPTIFNSPANWPITDCFEHTLMALDTISYMTDDVLVKVDRAAMANSLETRVPFLDHRLVELAWQMPLKYKIRNGEGKWLLRQVLNRYVPHELVNRPKAGFAIPLEKWLRGPLRDWAQDLLEPNRIKQEGYFCHEAIQKMLTEHVSGKKNWQHRLWSILMFQSWLGLK